jgi:3-oxoacyl-[acyl-carrier protein] reductase
MSDLSGKTALVTGASRGIGRASALALAKAGAQVVVHYGRGAKEAEAVVAEIRNTGGRADMVAADLAAPDGAHTLAKRVRGIVGDRLDILVLNAGVSKAATIEDTTVEDFDHLFAVNVRAPFFLVQQLLPILRNGSNVVLLSSLGARAAVGTLLSAYSASKGAVDALVKPFAAALGPRGIRVNAVAPGVTDTEMSNFAKPRAARASSSGCRHCNASPNRPISDRSSPSSHPTALAGSPARPSTSMAVRSSDTNPAHTRRDRTDDRACPSPLVYSGADRTHHPETPRRDGPSLALAIRAAGGTSPAL